jgi:hypothetical protein
MFGLVTGCAGARAASFALATAGCDDDPGRCEAACRQTPPDRDACGFINLTKSERLAVALAEKRQPKTPEEADELRASNLVARLKGLDELCADGIDRACHVAKRLRPHTKPADAGPRTASSAPAGGEAGTGVHVRAERVRAKAREALSVFGITVPQEGSESSASDCDSGRVAIAAAETVKRAAGENCGDTCQAAAIAIAMADQAECQWTSCVRRHGRGSERRCAEQAETSLSSAEAKADKADKYAEEGRKTQQQAAAWQATKDRCDPNPDTCKKECEESNPAAFACVYMANAYVTGKNPRVQRDVPKGRKLFREACGAGNGAACDILNEMDSKSAGCQDDEECKFFCDAGFPSSCMTRARMFADGSGVPKNSTTANALWQRACDLGEPQGCAPKDLPRLFAQCAANKRKVEASRIQGIEAARRGDEASAAKATKDLQDLEPSWNDTLNKLRVAIAVITNDQGDEFKRLIQRVQRECDCSATPSGRCR